jgi:pyridoxine 4-dehydrogenase
MNTTTFLGDRPINRIGHGAMQLAGRGVFGPPRDPGAARARASRGEMAAIQLELDDADLAALDRVGQQDRG